MVNGVCCRQTKQIRVGISRARTNWLDGNNRGDTNLLVVGIRTGHCRVKGHLPLMRIVEDAMNLERWRICHLWHSRDEPTGNKQVQNGRNTILLEENGVAQTQTDPENRSRDSSGLLLLVIRN